MAAVSGIIVGIAVALLCLAFVLDCLHQRGIEGNKRVVLKRKSVRKKPAEQEVNNAGDTQADKAVKQVGSVRIADCVPEMWEIDSDVPDP
jgi:hypothetical protein